MGLSDKGRLSSKFPASLAVIAAALLANLAFTACGARVEPTPSVPVFRPQAIVVPPGPDIEFAACAPPTCRVEALFAEPRRVPAAMLSW